MPFISSIRGNFSGIGRGRSARDGLSPGTAGLSARQIKAETGTNTDGVYWIKPSADAPLQEIFCLMDSAYDGGGWQIMANNSADAPLYKAAHYPRLTSKPEFVGTDGTNSYSTAGRWSINCQGFQISDVAFCAYSGTFTNIITYIYGKFTTPRTIPNSEMYVRIFDQFHQSLPWLTATDIRTRPAVGTEPVSPTTSFSAFGLHDGDRGDTTFQTSAGIFRYRDGQSGRPSDNKAWWMGYESAPAAGAGFPLVENDSNSHGMGGIFSWADRDILSADGAALDPPVDNDTRIRPIEGGTAADNDLGNSIQGWDDYQDGNSLGHSWGAVDQTRLGLGAAAFIMIRSPAI
jgi:hypothetical protein